MFQVINLPIPYPGADQKLGPVDRYMIKTEFLALNLNEIRVVDEQGSVEGQLMRWEHACP